MDLGEPELAEPMIHKFLGRIIELSMQKFSSNVIEKVCPFQIQRPIPSGLTLAQCIRVSSKETRALMVKEIVNPPELEKLIRDSYANYVIQTAVCHKFPSCPPKLTTNLPSSSWTTQKRTAGRC